MRYAQADANSPYPQHPRWQKSWVTKRVYPSCFFSSCAKSCSFVSTKSSRFLPIKLNIPLSIRIASHGRFGTHRKKRTLTSQYQKRFGIFSSTPSLRSSASMKMHSRRTRVAHIKHATQRTLPSSRLVRTLNASVAFVDVMRLLFWVVDGFNVWSISKIGN